VQQKQEQLLQAPAEPAQLAFSCYCHVISSAVAFSHKIQDLHKITTEKAQSDHEQRTWDLAHRKQEPRQWKLRAKLLDRAIQRMHDTIVRRLVLVLLRRVDPRDVR